MKLISYWCELTRLVCNDASHIYCVPRPPVNYIQYPGEVEVVTTYLYQHHHML
ncbi:unnamed protein product [Amoebophrya sp. A25]|nr:unnamed protein product [Amoebophrya sp. A25]|eukprot:GSA25T00011736001.1